MLLPLHSNGLIAVKKTPETVNSQVVFGTPSRNCSGSGICKVYTIHGAKRLNISCEMVKVCLTLSKNQLYLSFSKSACSEQLIQQQLTSGQFEIEENFELPSWLNRKFKSPALYVPKGSYPLQLKNGFFWLSLSVERCSSPS